MNDKDKGKEDPAILSDKDSQKAQKQPARINLEDQDKISDNLPPGLISDLKSFIENAPDPETAGQLIHVAIQHTRYGESHPFIPSKLLKEYHDINPEFSKQILDAFWEK